MRIRPRPRAPSPINHGPTLTQDFARGWHKLPEELKIEILRHNLVSPTGIKISLETVYEDNKLIFQKATTLSTVLGRHLAMGAFIAPFVRDIYYKDNIFIISSPPLSHRTITRLPPRQCRPLIRNLRVEVWLNSEGLSTIHTFASNQYGFDNARYITVHIRWPRREDDDYKKVLKYWVVSFECKGEVTFGDEHFRHYNLRPEELMEYKKQMEQRIRDKIIFAS